MTFTMFSIFFVPLMIVKRNDIYWKITYLGRKYIPKIPITERVKIVILSIFYFSVCVDIFVCYVLWEGENMNKNCLKTKRIFI